MKLLSKIKNNLPSPASALLAIVSAILLILAFPDFEFWFLAWFALIPLFIAIEREKKSFTKSFLLGWLFGIVFFFGTCWWLTFAPITYAKIPALLAYFLLLCATIATGFPLAIFGGIFSLFLKRFGHWGILSAPFLWTALEFLRLWTTGNNWNAIGYSQAFNENLIQAASIGGVSLISFAITLFNAYIALSIVRIFIQRKTFKNRIDWTLLVLIFFILSLITIIPDLLTKNQNRQNEITSQIISIQPNVPMSGLNRAKWGSLRQRQIDLAENALSELKSQKPITKNQSPITVILPESPMNFQYDEDAEFQSFINRFAQRNNVSVLFNSAEPDKRREFSYFNSAVMINEKGEKVAQYDKVYLLPFGEKVPLPESIEWIIPTMVGRFSSGEEYDLLPFGDAKAGVMICFESHFPSLSREYVRNGADVLVEMTNDGYLGNTPVLRQHLASAVFRAVETNRPVLRVTNVGITAYINERGEVLDAADVYTEATRAWSVSKSDGKQTIYTKYGEWFAWICSFVSLALLFLCFWSRKDLTTDKIG